MKYIVVTMLLTLTACNEEDVARIQADHQTGEQAVFFGPHQLEAVQSLAHGGYSFYSANLTWNDAENKTKFSGPVPHACQSFDFNNQNVLVQIDTNQNKVRVMKQIGTESNGLPNFEGDYVNWYDIVSDGSRYTLPILGNVRFFKSTQELEDHAYGFNPMIVQFDGLNCFAIVLYDPNGSV